MIEQFNIQFDEHLIKGEMRNGTPMVVFSHGFGVKRDSRGMFTDIANALPKEWGYVMFDYNHLNEQEVTLAPYSKQVEMLRHVIEFAAKHSPTVHLIGHSMGAITASLLSSLVPEKVILLAPPLHGPSKSSHNSWAERPGAHYEGTTLIVPRRDGTTSRIPQQFFDEAKSVDCLRSISRYAEQKKLTVIQALEEDIIKDTELYDTLINDTLDLIKLSGNHNFDSPHRTKLLSKIADILK